MELRKKISLLPAQSFSHSRLPLTSQARVGSCGRSLCAGAASPRPGSWSIFQQHPPTRAPPLGPGLFWGWQGPRDSLGWPESHFKKWRDPLACSWSLLWSCLAFACLMRGGDCVLPGSVSPSEGCGGGVGGGTTTSCTLLKTHYFLYLHFEMCFCLVISPLWSNSGAEKSHFGRYGEVRKTEWTPFVRTSKYYLPHTCNNPSCNAEN